MGANGSGADRAIAALGGDSPASGANAESGPVLGAPLEIGALEIGPLAIVLLGLVLADIGLLATEPCGPTLEIGALDIGALDIGPLGIELRGGASGAKRTRHSGLQK